MAAHPTFAVPPSPSRHQVLKRGLRFMEPDVFRCVEPAGSVVVKDYGRYRGTLWSFMATWLVRRERRFLALAATQGISPAPLVSKDPLMLAMEWVEGRPPTQGDDALMAQAHEHLQRMHALGVAHNDVHLSNVMVANGKIVLLDWASAVRRAWWVPKHLFEQLLERDRAHLTKMNARFSGRPLTAAEQAEQTPPFWVRGPLALWRRLYRGS